MTSSDEMEERVTRAIADGIEQADPNLPLILTAHASVQRRDLRQ